MDMVMEGWANLLRTYYSPVTLRLLATSKESPLVYKIEFLHLHASRHPFKKKKSSASGDPLLYFY